MVVSCLVAIANPASQLAPAAWRTFHPFTLAHALVLAACAVITIVILWTGLTWRGTRYGPKRAGGKASPSKTAQVAKACYRWLNGKDGEVERQLTLSTISPELKDPTRPRFQRPGRLYNGHAPTTPRLWTERSA
jgi:hypothetical protein